MSSSPFDLSLSCSYFPNFIISPTFVDVEADGMFPESVADGVDVGAFVAVAVTVGLAVAVLVVVGVGVFVAVAVAEGLVVDIPVDVGVDSETVSFG